MALNVIARYRDGKLIKGTTINFRPNATYCHIESIDHPYDEGIKVEFKDLKAIFFVKSLEGNPYYKAKKDFVHAPGYGRRVKVIFEDGEEMVGYVQGQIDRSKPGIFVYPGDPLSNNERIFAVNEYVKTVEFLPPPGAETEAEAETEPEAETETAEEDAGAPSA